MSRLTKRMSGPVPRRLAAAPWLSAVAGRIVRTFAAQSRLGALGVALSLMLLAGVAPAQSFAPLTAVNVSRTVKIHDVPKKAYWISRDDCVANDELTFQLVVTGWNSYNFEVWAGDKDCKQLNQRTGELAECWLVYKDRAEAQYVTVTLKARDIVAHKRPRNLDDPDDTRGIGTLSDCDDPWTGSFTLYFMYVDDSGNVSGTPATWTQTGVDTNGPTPPSNVRTGIANESLALHWDVSTSTDLIGYKFYCLEDHSADNALDSGASTAAPTATAAPTVLLDAGDSGLLKDGGSSGEQPVDVSGTCGEGLLAKGEYPPTNSRVFACGEVATTSGNGGYATGLKNDVVYAVGVAGVDDLGNPGQLSNVVCESPQYVKQFFSDYRNKGGVGGGGFFCNLGRLAASSSNPSWPSLLGLFGLGLIGVLRLRRRT